MWYTVGVILNSVQNLVKNSMYEKGKEEIF